MNKEAAEVLKAIADKLDVPIEVLWQGLVTYAQFEYLQWWVIGIVGITLLLLAGVSIWLAFKVEELRGSVDTQLAFAVAGFVMGVIGVIALLVFALNFGNAMAAKHAPEAWAVKEILRR